MCTKKGKRAKQWIKGRQDHRKNYVFLGSKLFVLHFFGRLQFPIGLILFAQAFWEAQREKGYRMVRASSNLGVTSQEILSEGQGVWVISKILSA
jgi:hypothetical protein